MLVLIFFRLDVFQLISKVDEWFSGGTIRISGDPEFVDLSQLYAYKSNLLSHPGPGMDISEKKRKMII